MIVLAAEASRELSAETEREIRAMHRAAEIPANELFADSTLEPEVTA